MFRQRGDRREVLLVHPGGPFWAKRDDGAWSIPKGEFADGEDPLVAAEREFQEELGVPPPVGPRRSIGSIRQAGGKVVDAWAVEGDLDVKKIKSNVFELEWPPRSGRMKPFPEVDRGDWFDEQTARRKINASQAVFLDRLEAGS
jgi:predicted NUDIX family NTP pyrophosphohydrolase